MSKFLVLFITCVGVLNSAVNGFIPSSLVSRPNVLVSRNSGKGSITLNSSNEDDSEYLNQKTFGGYTVKQRLREEIESPFRTVRLVFFGSSTGSAFIALYFSSLNALKAANGIGNGPTLDDSLTSCAINFAALLFCAGLTYWDYQNGERNLARIAKGGALARLQVKPVAEMEDGSASRTVTLKEYRRTARVLIAAGGPEYITTLARSLNSDQLADENQLPQQLLRSEIILVPVLLDKDYKVGDTQSFWQTEVKEVEGTDRNFDIHRADNVVAFPAAFSGAWADYLKSEIETAVKKQQIDVFEKGITITVKKNGRILKRTTGQPPWNFFLSLMGDGDSAMEVLDGSKFGMPGDSEKYEKQNS